MTITEESKRVWLQTPGELILEGAADISLKYVPEVFDQMADLIVTSPPYNLQGGIQYDTVSDTMSVPQYFEEFSYAWLKAAWDISRPAGRLCLNVPVDVSRPYPIPFASYMIQQAERAGWRFRYHIWWYDGHRGTSMARGSTYQPSKPYIYAGMEVILVFYRQLWGLRRNGRATDMLPYEFVDWTNGLWTFPGESPKKRNHPAPFPEELVRRCVRLFTYPGEGTLIVDPFNGSGTTTSVGKETWRNVAGIDISPAYCAMASKRTEQTERASNREAYRRLRKDIPA